MTGLSSVIFIGVLPPNERALPAGMGFGKPFFNREVRRKIFNACSGNLSRPEQNRLNGELNRINDSETLLVILYDINILLSQANKAHRKAGYAEMVDVIRKAKVRGSAGSAVAGNEGEIRGPDPEVICKAVIQLVIMMIDFYQEKSYGGATLKELRLVDEIRGDVVANIKALKEHLDELKVFYSWLKSNPSKTPYQIYDKSETIMQSVRSK